jgi:hypothetical protein
MHVKVAFRCGLHTVWGDAGALASRNLSTSAEGIPPGRPLSFSRHFPRWRCLFGIAAVIVAIPVKARQSPVK